MPEEFTPSSLLTNILKSKGFRKNGNCWFKETDDHYYYFVLYSGSYGGGDKYLDMRITFKKLLAGNESFQKKWHGSLHIHEQEVLNGAMSYQHEFKGLSADERNLRLKKGMLDLAVPEIEKLSSVQGIIKMWNENESFLLTPEARNLIGITGRKAVCLEAEN